MRTKQQFENIYDEFRTLTLNKEYYSRKMSRSRSWLKGLDIFLAIFAAGSGVLGFALWKQEFFGLPIGPTLLSLATGIALVLGIARPYFKLEDNLERLSSIHGSYSAIAFIMEDVVKNIKTNEEVDETSEAIYTALRQVRGSFVAKEDAPADRELIDEMQKIVNQRYPMDTFYYPPQPASPATFTPLAPAAAVATPVPPAKDGTAA